MLHRAYPRELYVQRWSNGLHRAALHRVSTVRRDRMSIQYNHRPDYGKS